ncbi:sugar phosphate nucleotidyltransferase [Methylomagnum sp.]
MKTMILAASQGTGLKPLTDSIPKPMIPLINKPVMECIIDHLKRFGVTEIVVNTSYLPAAIEEYFRDGGRFGTQIAYSFEGKVENDRLAGLALGSAGGMKRIQQFSGFFDGTFLVVCGDALFDLDLAEALDFHRRKHAVATVALRNAPAAEARDGGFIQTDGDSKVVGFQAPPNSTGTASHYASTGIYIFEPKVFEHIPAWVEYDIDSQLLPALAEAGLPCYGYAKPFQWLDINAIPDYWAVMRKILNGEVRHFRMPGREVRPGIHAGIHLSVDWNAVKIVPPVYIGSGTRIEPGVEIIGPAMIGANCLLETGAVVRECLIHDYTRVAGIAHLENKIITGNHCIDPSGHSLDIKSAGIDWIVGDARREIALDAWQRQIHMMATAGGRGTLV